MKLVVLSSLKHNGERYAKGDPINLSGAAAERLVALGVVAKPGQIIEARPKDRRTPQSAALPAQTPVQQPKAAESDAADSDETDEDETEDTSGLPPGINSSLT